MTTDSTKQKTFHGTVVKMAGKDTTVVSISRYVKHPKYKKYRVRTKKYLVHDPGNTAQIGDTVTVMECRPVSKTKHFKLAN